LPTAASKPERTEWVELVANLEVPDVPDGLKMDAYVLVKGYADAGQPPCGIVDDIRVTRP
jgi:hypothetical protein